MSSEDDLRQLHIDGFADAFVGPRKRERYRTLLSNPKKRSKITDRLNHHSLDDFKLSLIVKTAPRYSSKLTAYIISDCRDIDDRFVVVGQALELLYMSQFGTVVSLIPGILAAVKPEAPEPAFWLHRPIS